MFAVTDGFNSSYEPRNNGRSWYARRRPPNRRFWPRRAHRRGTRVCNQRWYHQLDGPSLIHGDEEMEENLFIIT